MDVLYPYHFICFSSLVYRMFENIEVSDIIFLLQNIKVCTPARWLHLFFKTNYITPNLFCLQTVLYICSKTWNDIQSEV